MVVLFGELAVGVCKVAAVFWPALLGKPISGQDQKWYESNYKQVVLAPPKAVFWPVWLVLYALVSAALVMYGPTDMTAVLDNLDITCLSMLFINLTFNHLWSKIFFASRRPDFAAAVAFMIFASGLVSLVIMGIQAEWVPFGLYILYVLWSLYAFCLNVNWLVKVPATKKPKNIQTEAQGQEAQEDAIESKFY